MIRLTFPQKTMSLILALLSCSNINLYSETTSWRALPVTSKSFHTRIDLIERAWNNFSPLALLRSFSKTLYPLYHLGAPRTIYILRNIENNLSIEQIDFTYPNDKITIIRTKVDITEKNTDPELLDLIRKATGIETPTIEKSQQISTASLFALMLKNDTVFAYRPLSDALVLSAQERPFIFASPEATDEMIINAFKDITWNDIFMQLGTPTNHGIEYDADTIRHCKRAFERWHSYATCGYDYNDLMFNIKPQATALIMTQTFKQGITGKSNLTLCITSRLL